MRELFEEEDGGAEVVEQADDLGRGKGREIDRVPLCVDCAWEAGAEEMDRRAVEERGLKRVERVDGGLTRRRWEARQWGGKVTTMFKRKIAQVRGHVLCRLEVETLTTGLAGLRLA